MDQLTPVNQTSAPVPPVQGAIPQYRNMAVQVLLMVVTFGLYSIYWFYVTSKELVAVRGRGEEENVVLWLILFCFPPLCLYSYYKQGEYFELVSNGTVNRWIVFLLWMVFPPAVWLLVQSRLNDLSGRR